MMKHLCFKNFLYSVNAKHEGTMKIILYHWLACFSFGQQSFLGFLLSMWFFEHVPNARTKYTKDVRIYAKKLKQPSQWDNPFQFTCASSENFPFLAAFATSANPISLFWSLKNKREKFNVITAAYLLENCQKSEYFSLGIIGLIEQKKKTLC